MVAGCPPTYPALARTAAPTLAARGPWMVTEEKRVDVGRILQAAPSPSEVAAPRGGVPGAVSGRTWLAARRRARPAPARQARGAHGVSVTAHPPRCARVVVVRSAARRSSCGPTLASERVESEGYPGAQAIPCIQSYLNKINSDNNF